MITTSQLFYCLRWSLKIFYIFLHSTHSYELIFESSLDLCGWNTALSSSRCLAGDNNKSVILLPEMVVTDFFKFSLHSTHSYELIFESSLDLCGWNTALSSSRCLAGDNNKSVILLPEMVVKIFLNFFAFHSLVRVNFWVLPWFVWLKYSTIIQPVLSRW